MPTRPRLIASIPFWGLLVVSLATIAGGWYLTNDKLGSMTRTLTDGTATGVDVYVGQSVAQLGAILIGAGIIGVLLTLAVAALSTLRPVPAVEVVEPLDWDAQAAPAEAVVPAAAPAPAEAAPAAAEAAPVVETAPAAAEAPVADAAPAADDTEPEAPANAR